MDTMKTDNYNPKLKVVDKNDITNVNPDKNVIYSGNFNFIKSTIKKPDNDLRPLAAAILGLNNTAAPLPQNLEFYHTWTDIDSQEAFLNTKPTCYIILGKPGTGGYSLGESMAKKLNVVHISPKTVIVDEMEQKSITGKCIDFNLRHNNICKYDTIMAIMKKKIQSPAVQHRGYVISGIPLVTSKKNIEYFTKNLYEEESVLIAEEIVDGITENVFKKRRKGRKHDTEALNSSQSSANMLEIESEIEEEEDEQEPDADIEEETVQIVALPKFILEPSSGVIISKKSSLSSKQSVMLQQCQELFDLQTNPVIIIFITCPDPDAITKKNRKYFNYLTSSSPMYPFTSRNESDIRWPTKYAVNENVLNPIDTSVLNRKYYCRLPINFTSNATNQMCNYQFHVSPYLDKKIKDFPSKFVIKLDGRNPIYEMANFLFDKLLLLPVKPVLIPEPLYLEEPSDDIESFWKLAEEMNVIKFGAKRFSRYASPWYNRCPVELKKRHAVQGLSRFAVAFFNRIYLLSSLDNMVAFCRNPRSFLKLQYLEPTCRVIVTGTKLSGKSMVAECLSWLFNAPITCYASFVNDLRQRKFDDFTNSIWSIIEEKVERHRLTDWENKEENKMTNLNSWYTSCVEKLKNYIRLQKEYLSIKDEVLDDNASAKRKGLFNRVQKLYGDLQFFPFLDEVEICEQVLDDHSLLQYAPPELTEVIPKPAAPVLGDDDVMEAIYAYISENNRQNDVEPNCSEIMQELTTKLANLDIQTQTESNGEHEYGKYIIDGFPSDAEYWDFLLGTSLAPDYTVAIIEDREMDEDVERKYINLTISTKNHETRFRLANDPLVKIKLESKYTSTPEPVTLECFINDIINRIILSIFTNKSEIINTLNESINKFRDDWEGLKSSITNTDKACIEVQIDDKSDIEILDEVLVKIRNSYYPEGNTEVDETFENQGSEESTSKDSLIQNDPRFLCETNIYCPVTYYDYGVLWEGRPEFTFEYDNKLHYFCKEDFLNRFQGDVTKYQSYNDPFKKLSPMRICVMGPIGSGRTSAAKLIAKEYGLMYIDFVEFINNYLIPRHYKRVGRQYENSFTDTPIDEEVMTELNMNEDNVNLEVEILSNEIELRRMVYNYLEKGTAIVPILMQKLIKKLWFQPPFSTTGFVLDGYPKLQNDVEDMTECFCIPDLIIELECNSEISSQRLSPKLFDVWKIQLNEAKQKARIKFDNEKRQWKNFITKHVVVKLIIDTIIDTIGIEAIDQAKNLSIQSTIIEAHPSGMSNVDTNLFQTYNNLITEYPEPVDQSTWEKPSEVREKIAYRIESTYEIEDENIQTLKETLMEQNIKLTTINGTKSFIKVGRILLSKVANLRNKREMCFEQSFMIDLDVAEMLLLEGFFFLSKFYRMCPVFIYDNPDAIFNPYSVSKSKNKIVPVIHRSHIYFCNDVNVKKFRENPLKYIVNDNIKHFVEYPLRVAVIGPPKSGKSELTAKIAKKYGLLCVSKGIALRHIVNDLSWTELALKTLSKLDKGESVSNYVVMQAVQTLINNHCSSSRGYILDGLPSTPFEALELQKLGLFPLIIFELRGNSRIMIKNSQKEIYLNIIKTKPPYSCNLIRHRLAKYNKKCNTISEFINNDTQNLLTLNAEESRWECFYKADNKICEIIPQIHFYLTNYKTTAVPMSVMCISDNDFQLKMSNYKNLCPVCLSDDIIKHSGYPVDKKGIVQYKEHVYWICNEHLDLVLKNPDTLLKEKVGIPEIPTVVKTINPFNLYEDGICIVTYAENLPAQIIEKGKEEYAAVYKEITYLFCCPYCLRKFLATPKMYYDITVFKECKVFPTISLKSLPHLGYLEQTVGNLITEACCSVNVARPKYPGLSAQISGLLYVAFYLKIHNPLTDVSYLPLYKKSLKTFESRCQLMTSVGLRLRSIDNPFAHYPKCCNLKDIQDVTEPKPIATDSGTVMKPSSIKQESVTSFTCLCDSD
ncbi:PREDICTED: adenylate kinase 9-like [Papilio xuthus]|uniref:Adenylate kinase 9-like n=1 Tax=Papilio xuthus TaxID=66420 RepID=A0AAJ6ZZ27_PAPXU|nr:PREDICTED: adenylate kinase 9-like [Papilio xuthus]